MKGDRNMEYNDIEIELVHDTEIMQEHLEQDFKVLMEIGIDNLIKEKLIPWITATDFKDKNPDKIFEGLKLYEIDYNYLKIIAQYSPTGEENYFGQFDFCFESGNEYTDDILEAVGMTVYVLEGKVVEVEGYDI